MGISASKAGGGEMNAGALDVNSTPLKTLASVKGSATAAKRRFANSVTNNLASSSRASATYWCPDWH